MTKNIDIESIVEAAVAKALAPKPYVAPQLHNFTPLELVPPDDVFTWTGADDRIVGQMRKNDPLEGLTGKEIREALADYRVKHGK